VGHEPGKRAALRVVGAGGIENRLKLEAGREPELASEMKSVVSNIAIRIPPHKRKCKSPSKRSLRASTSLARCPAVETFSRDGRSDVPGPPLAFFLTRNTRRHGVPDAGF
jgi:hypothetical protein